MSDSLRQRYSPWQRGGALLAVILMTACGADPVRPNDSVPTRLSLSLVSGELSSLGDTAIVRPQVYDQHGLLMPGVPVQWTLSSVGVLEPAGNGTFRAIGSGDVTIRGSVALGPTGVRPGGYWADALTATTNVRVQQRARRVQVTLVDTAFTTLNASRRLRVVATDARGNVIQSFNEAAEFRSTNPEIVSVDPTGLVRSLKAGSAQVTVRVADLNAAVTLSVDPRLSHTACMVYAQRRRTRQDCVTNGFTVYARREQP